MVVYISNDVKKELNNYRKSLRNYPISRERATKKYNDMADALLSLGNDQTHCTPCVHKDLGQRFDIMGNVIFKNLYRFNYQDTSKFQWAFAVFIDKKNEKVTIAKMMPSSAIKESINRVLQKILEFNQRLLAIT